MKSWLSISLQLDEILLQSDKMLKGGANGVFVKALQPVTRTTRSSDNSSASIGVMAETQIAFRYTINDTDLDDAFAGNSSFPSEPAKSNTKWNLFTS